MKSFSITAQSVNGGELIWDENQSDFVLYEQEVPSTSIDEWNSALEKAKTYPALISISAQEIDWETGGSQIVKSQKL